MHLVPIFELTETLKDVRGKNLTHSRQSLFIQIIE